MASTGLPREGGEILQRARWTSRLSELERIRLEAGTSRAKLSRGDQGSQECLQRNLGALESSDLPHLEQRLAGAAYSKYSCALVNTSLGAGCQNVQPWHQLTFPQSSCSNPCPKGS